ncbi:MAG: RNA polymerase sigma factor [Armatimonadota bacterium]
MEPCCYPHRSSGPRAAVASDDRNLLLRAARGDAEAFTALFQRHRAGLQGYLYRKLRSADEAEDAVALTFLKAWRARESFRGSCPGKSWLYQVATRVALDLLRRRQRRPSELELDGGDAELPDLDLADDSLDPAGHFLERERVLETGRAVRGAVDRLAPEDRRLLALFYFEGYDYSQISSILGVSRSQVRGRLHRIRGRLRHELEGSSQLVPS